jgi:uncharacterized protein (TIGR01777 family)
MPIVRYDFESGEIHEKIGRSDVVINLAGAPIIKRWSKRYKEELLRSRIETTATVVDAVNNCPVEYLISASAIGIYPDNMACDEDCPYHGSDFLAGLAKRWEKTARDCVKKTAILRLGVVLGTHGGALKKMLLPFRLGLGGPIGSGDMIMSWIVLHDLARICEFLIGKRSPGVFNATSPKPVTNREFSKALGSVLGRPAFLPVPEFMLKLIFGEAASVLISSKEVYPRMLLEAGFVFRYPEIAPALESIFQ